jgi:hypothetical protein
LTDRLLRGVGAAALLALLTATPWYSTGRQVAGALVPAATAHTISGWNALTDLRWLLVLSCLAAAASLAPFGVLLRIARWLAAASVLLLLVRVLIARPHSEATELPSVFAYVALIAAGAMFVGTAQAGAKPAAPR